MVSLKADERENECLKACIYKHDTNRIANVTIRFLSSSWFFVTFNLPAGNKIYEEICIADFSDASKPAGSPALRAGAITKGQREHERKKKSADGSPTDQRICSVDCFDTVH